jgi:hypothetical protein
MWVLPVTRRDLVDLITPRRGGDVPGAVEEFRPSFDIVRLDTMAAVWPAPPAEFGRFPTAIIVPDGTRRDTMAWLSTYVRDFRPFTAYCRVVERPTAELFLRAPPLPMLRGTEGICSGLILGEALTHAKGRASAFELPATAYSATLSHAIGRTLALTGVAFPTDAVASLWSQVREMTGQNGLGVPPKAILSVWAVALGSNKPAAQSRSLFEQENILAAAWSELASTGEIRSSIWHHLVEGQPELERMREMFDVPREQRVELIDIALRVLASYKHGDEDRRGFLAGYFISRLGPGTLDHADLLAPFVSILPMVYLWYGLFAGANPKGDALPVGNPLARRIVRDLTIPDRLIDRPRCDVALEELSMNGLSENLLRLTAKAGRLDIDILPGVTTSVRRPPHDVPNDAELRRARRESEARHLLSEMEIVSTHWRQLSDRLRELLGGPDGDGPQAAKRRKGGKS